MLILGVMPEILASKNDLRRGNIVRAEFHGHPAYFGGRSCPSEYVRVLDNNDPPIQVMAAILQSKSAPSIMDGMRKAADEHGKIAVVAAEIPTKQGHLEFLPDESNDARLDRFAQTLPMFEDGQTPAVEAIARMYGEFGAIPVIVHPNPKGGLMRKLILGMIIEDIRTTVFQLRDRGIQVSIGVEKYSSETDRFFGPFNSKRVEEINKVISDLAPLGVGEVGSSDDHGHTLGWAHTEWKTDQDIHNAKDLLVSFGRALYFHRTQAVENKNVGSYAQWVRGLFLLGLDHLIPRFERFLIDTGLVPKGFVRRLDLSEKYSILSGQSSPEARAWRQTLKQTVERLSFADIHHQNYPFSRVSEPVLALVGD